MGRNYTPLQNVEAFDFFDLIVGERAAIYHTAGALGRGQRIWILAKLPTAMRVIGDDITDKFLLLTNNHDGESAVQIKFTPIRVVCQNTLTFALQGGATLRVAHTRSMQDRLLEADQILGIVHMRYATIEEHFKAMARVQLSGQRLSEYLEKVFPWPRRKQENLRCSIERNRMKAEYFFVEGKGNRLGGVRGTLWAAYNGVIELVDHRVSDPKVGRVQSADRRLQSLVRQRGADRGPGVPGGLQVPAGPELTGPVNATPGATWRPSRANSANSALTGAAQIFISFAV